MASRDDPLILHPTGFTGPVKAALGLAAAELAGAAAWAVLHGNAEFLFYLLIFVPALAMLGLLHRRIRFSYGMFAALSLLLLLHLAGGLTELSRRSPTEGRKLLYNLWLLEPYLKYDNLVHAFGSGLATWFCWQLLQRTVASRTGWAFRDLRPTPELLLFCVLSGMGIGSVNEILEFYTTRLVPDNNVGGYVNNSLDLVSNFVGSALAVAAIWLHPRWKKS